MKAYLASRWSRRRELQAYAIGLADRGHEVTSRWLWRLEDNVDDLSDVDMAADVAAEDLVDVMLADTLILFTEAPRTATRGGRLIECGFAMGLRRRVITIGPVENVFLALDEIRNFGSWSEFDRQLVRDDLVSIED